MMRPLVIALLIVLLLAIVPSGAWPFEPAREPRAWSFPADHASHPSFGTEWWYFTGSLRDENDHRYGFQLTFFRVAMRPEPVESTSDWRARDLILGHLAVTDVARDTFDHDEVVQRAAAGLAGAREDRFEVWAGSWRASQEGEGFRLQAQGEDVGVDLVLPGQGVPVLHGEGGLSRKSADGSAASHYYSLPRLPTYGSIRAGGRQMEVRGVTWMDHEFFTGKTPAEGIGWDWFSVRFDDGRDLMLYTVRHPDAEPYRFATLVAADGSSRPLDLQDLQTEPLAHWTSPDTRTRYPVAWKITIPAEHTVLDVRATVAGQEIDAARSVGFAYWEGLCDFQGVLGGQPVTGEGYVELTGY